MTSRLDGLLKRELEIAGAPYTLTIAPDGMTLALKGRRRAFELQQLALVSGDATIAALNASLTAKLTPSSEARKKPASPRGKSKAGPRHVRDLGRRVRRPFLLRDADVPTRNSARVRLREPIRNLILR